MADGLAAVALMASLFDEGQDDSKQGSAVLEPELLPADASLLVDRPLGQDPRNRPGGLYRFRTRRKYCDLRFGRMSWLRQDRGLCPFDCST